MLRTFFLFIVPEGVVIDGSTRIALEQDDSVDVFVGTTDDADDTAGSMAIRLNFRFRFVFGRMGETFSLWESDSLAGTDVRAEFLKRKKTIIIARFYSLTNVAMLLE